MQKRSCYHCQGGKIHCCLTHGKSGHCSGLWQADLDEFLSFLTLGSCYGKLLWCFWMQSPVVEGLPGMGMVVDGIRMAGAQRWHRKWSLGSTMPRSVHFYRGDGAEYGQAHPAVPSSPPLIASSLFISYLPSLCSGSLAEMSKAGEGNEKLKSPKPLYGIQLSFLVGLKGKVSCRFCLFILYSCFILH